MPRRRRGWRDGDAGADAQTSEGIVHAISQRMQIAEQAMQSGGIEKKRSRRIQADARTESHERRRQRLQRPKIFGGLGGQRKKIGVPRFCFGKGETGMNGARRWALTWITICRLPTVSISASGLCQSSGRRRQRRSMDQRGMCAQSTCFTV